MDRHVCIGSYIMYLEPSFMGLTIYMFPAVLQGSYLRCYQLLMTQSLVSCNLPFPLLIRLPVKSVGNKAVYQHLNLCLHR